MKPGMKPDNFQQIYEKCMKPGMKLRYETGLPEKKIPHMCIAQAHSARYKLNHTGDVPHVCVGSYQPVTRLPSEHLETVPCPWLQTGSLNAQGAC